MLKESAVVDLCRMKDCIPSSEPLSTCASDGVSEQSILADSCL